MSKKLRLLSFLWILVSSAALVAQTSTNVRYIYDEIGQLIGVIDENNNAMAYTYDALGNLTSSERLIARGAVDIFFVEPNRGKAAVPTQPGTPVTIHGIGFSATPAENQVTFNGVMAVVDSATTTMIKTSVPTGATTGPVRVTSPLGTAASRSDFIVTNVFVSVSPARAQVATRLTQQFTATLTEVGTVIGGDVLWSVNRIVGGNPTVGTIDRNGLYRAPEAVPQPPMVTVTATSTEEPAASGDAMVTIIQSIGPLASSLSYRIGRPEELPKSPIATQGVSYRTGTPEQLRTGPITVPGTSYRIGRPEQMALAPIFDRGPSYTSIVITGLTPGQVLRGATDVPFTVTGRNFNRATALDFLLPSGARDSNVTVAGLAVNPDGTQITGRISVAGGAATGARTVVVQTPAGPSARAATASNQLVIQ